MRYEQFVKFMADDCGMPMTEDGAVHCCECEEPIYEEDFEGHDWSECPVCGFNITE